MTDRVPVPRRVAVSASVKLTLTSATLDGVDRSIPLATTVPSELIEHSWTVIVTFDLSLDSSAPATTITTTAAIRSAMTTTGPERCLPSALSAGSGSGFCHADGPVGGPDGDVVGGPVGGHVGGPGCGAAYEGAPGCGGAVGGPGCGAVYEGGPGCGGAVGGPVGGPGCGAVNAGGPAGRYGGGVVLSELSGVSLTEASGSRIVRMLLLVVGLKAQVSGPFS